MQKKKRVWFITGTSHGFGYELVRSALKRGDSVIATSRTPEKVSEAFPDASDRLLTLAMDLKDPKAISSSIKSAIERFGQIDVLINNAGYGLLGAVEEASDVEIANIFNINVFGLIRVTNAILPYFRKQKSGHIVNLSSIGGLIGMPGWGIYNSTKFAIEGVSEALAEELAPLGIHVTIVEPGPFRTNFLGEGLKFASQKIPDYEQTAGQLRNYVNNRSGKQAGDPAAAAEAIIEAVTSEKPPLHLLLGAIAYKRAFEKLDMLQADFNTWRSVTLATDFKEEAAP